MNILLIEDNPDHVLILRDMLDSHPEKQTHMDNTENFDEGINKLNLSHYDICLCDLSLPDSSMENTIAVLQSINVCTPIIVLSSLDNMDIEKKLIQSGIQDFILKSELSPPLLFRVCVHAIERKRLHQKIQDLSIRDPLTNLFNKREFDRILKLQVSTAKRHPFPLCLCVIDVDNFKDVNDGFGHLAGDNILLAVSEALKECTRETDVPCRIGGDEFALLLPHSDSTVATICAERIRSHLKEQNLCVGKREITVTLSFGISEYRPGMSIKNFFRQADKALYVSKKSGRDCITSEIDSMH